LPARVRTKLMPLLSLVVMLSGSALVRKRFYADWNRPSTAEH